MKKINCAIIGFGNIGKIQAEFLLNNKYTNLKCIFEKDKAIVRKFKNKYKKVNWVDNEDKIFHNKVIDLVIICSYDNFHYKQIIKAIKNKKNIFCEKPICQNLSQLRNIYNLFSKKNKLKFSSNFILRTVSEFKFLKKIVQNQKMGNIYYIEADYNYGRLEKITKGWRGRIPFYSVISGGGIHLIDIICNYLGEYPTAVFASANKIATSKSAFKFNDFVISVLKFKSKKISKVTANFGSVTPHHHHLKFFGTKGSFFKEYDQSTLISNRYNVKKNSKKFNFDKKYNKSELLNNFIKVLVKKLNLKKIPNFKDILKVMLICFAIEKSFKTNKEITINYKNLTLK